MPKYLLGHQWGGSVTVPGRASTVGWGDGSLVNRFMGRADTKSLSREEQGPSLRSLESCQHLEQ